VSQHSQHWHNKISLLLGSAQAKVQMRLAGSNSKMQLSKTAGTTPRCMKQTVKMLMPVFQTLQGLGTCNLPAVVLETSAMR
jgi:hypothetical protein